MTDVAFALYAAAECFACAISSSDLEEGVEYAEAAIAVLPPCGHPDPDFVRELVEARDWRCLEMISRELDRRARPVRVSQERISESFEVSKPAKRQRKPRIRKTDGLRTASERGSSEEAMAILGLPRRTVQNMAARGELPGAAKLGRVWTFDLAKLRRHVTMKERQAWQDGKQRPDATGGGIPSGVALRSGADSSAGRLTRMIQASQKRVAKLAKTEH
jgi:ribosomal protein S14